MSRLADALRSITADCSGADLAAILDIPKRTADRWLAELRSGDLGNWHGGVIERLSAHEASTWGTSRIADALRPMSVTSHEREKADASRVAAAMRVIVASHQINAELLGEMAADLSDGVLHDHEARALAPLVERALTATMDKHRVLVRLQTLLKNRLAGPS
jgi:hypothetical protein